MVFSAVRPSLGEINELYKKKHFLFDQGDIRPKNNVCLFVIGHYFVRTRSRLCLDGFHFHFAHGKNIHVYIEDVQGRIIFVVVFLMDFPKMVIIGISVIIDYGLYGRALLYP